MEMMPMLLIITMATYTLGKIAMMAVPVEAKQDKLLVRGLSRVFFFFPPGLSRCVAVGTDGKCKCPQDVNDLDAQVKVVEVLLKNGCGESGNKAVG